MALSDAAVRQTKPTGKNCTLGDIDGLSLSMTASGGRSWHVRYCWSGKQKRMSLERICQKLALKPIDHFQKQTWCRRQRHDCIPSAISTKVE